MPSKPEDTVRKDALYPDELVGQGLEPDPTRLNGGLAYWDASDDDDAEELPDDARYGWWLPVTHVGEDTEVWMAAPRSVREAILEAGIEPGEAFRIVGLEKGPADHDPYEAEVEYPYET